MLYFDEEINIVGIIPDRELTGTTNASELNKIIYDTLCIGPMLDPLITALKESDMVEGGTGDIQQQDVVKTLYSDRFLKICPLFVSRRETIQNIKLITAAMIILKRNYLTVDQIRHGLNAYILSCKETKQDLLYLVDDKIHRTLRLINMGISDDILKKWYEHVKYNLDWNKQERRKFEKEHRGERIDIPFILPHEFLFLLCNCVNRLNTINKMHNFKLDLKSQLDNIYQWEVSDGKPIKEMEGVKGMVRKIHLLRSDAFHNKAPQKLVTDCLNSEAENKRNIYLGEKPAKDGKLLAQLESQAYNAAQKDLLGGSIGRNKGLNKSSKRVQIDTGDLSKSGKGRAGLSLQQQLQGAVTPIEKDTYQRELNKFMSDYQQRGDLIDKYADFKKNKGQSQHQASKKMFNNYKAYIGYGKSKDNESEDDNESSFKTQEHGGSKKPQTATTNVIHGQDNRNQVKQYIKPETQSPIKEQKRLYSAVTQESRTNKVQPNNSFIEQNKNLFSNVSKINLKRAEQIRKQFKQQRKIVHDRLNQNHQQNRKPKLDIDSRNIVVSSTNYPQLTSARATTNKLLAKGSHRQSQTSLRPQSAFGGVAPPPRNIKAQMIQEVRKSADYDRGVLRNRLQNMTVLNQQQKMLTTDGSINADRNIHEGDLRRMNKEAVLNNWIQGELVRFESKQEFDQMDPEQQMLIKGIMMNRSQTNFQNKNANLLSPSQNDTRMSYDMQNRTSYGGIFDQKDHTQPEMNKIVSATNLNYDNSTTAYSMGTHQQNQRVVPMLNNQSNTTSEIRISINNNSGRIIPEEYKRLMLVKDPNRNNIVSSFGPKKNTVLMKQAVALQSGLGQGGMLQRDFSRASGNLTVNRSQKGPQASIARYTRDKRPISSYTSSQGMNTNPRVISANNIKDGNKMSRSKQLITNRTAYVNQ